MKTILKLFLLFAILYSRTMNVPGEYPTIQEAIDGSSDGDTINVAEGTYYENINFNGKSILINGESATNTFIDGQNQESVVKIVSGEENAQLKGFSIINGYAHGYGGSQFDHGAGVCILFSSNAVIENCIIRNGDAGYGGGISVAEDASTLIIKNTLIYNNLATSLGGGINAMNGSDVQIINCTISQNFSPTDIMIGGISIATSETSISIENSIVYGNSPNDIKHWNAYGCYESFSISYSNIGSFEGGCNDTFQDTIMVDPEFVDPESGDFHLSSDSPCIDAGDPDSPLDSDGSVSDMGAYPYQMTEPYYPNHSLSFDSVDDYVEVPFSSELNSFTDALSFSAWINIQGGEGAYRTVLENGNNQGFALMVGTGGDIYANVQNSSGWSSVYSGQSEALNTWHHVAVTFDSESLILYINGEERDNVPVTGLITNNNGNLWIGRYHDYENHFNGFIDEIVIWNTTLTQEQIQDNMNIQLSGMEEGLVSYWNFDDGEGSVLTDLTTNSNDGTIYGATWSDDGAPVMPAAIASVEVGTVQGYTNSEISVPVHINLMQEFVSSIEISFSEFQDHMEFVDIELEGAMVGDADWDVVLNSQEDLLLTLSYGANEISGEGVLFHLRFNIPEEIDTDFVPIMIDYVHLDENEEYIEILNGGVEINEIMWGDVSQNGDVSGYDASLVLKYLVGMEELDENQLLVADVTQDATISALDASAIAQYVVQLIDVLPLDDPASASGGGEFYVNDTELIPGEMLEIPIELANGENLLSFEFSAEYDESAFTLEEVVWSDLIDHFLIEENLVPGSINIAGMGTTPDGEEGTFGSFRLYVNPEFSSQNTSVSMSYRINESVPVENINVVITNSNLGIDNTLTPKMFALHQNYPNPFNPNTQIKYDLPEAKMVTVTIYDVTGCNIRTLMNMNKTAGYHSIRWDAKNDIGEGVAAGMYIYTVQAGDFRATKKMVLLK